MRDLALAFELLLISRILDQRMLEDVASFRRETALIKKFCSHQPAKLVLQCSIIQLRNCSEHHICKLLPDRSCQLQNVFHSRELIQSCQKRILKSCWNRQRRKWTG